MIKHANGNFKDTIPEIFYSFIKDDVDLLCSSITNSAVHVTRFDYDLKKLLIIIRTIASATHAGVRSVSKDANRN